MCEVRPDRIRKPGPPSPRMLALLLRMATGSPVLWDYRRGLRHDTYSLDGEPVEGRTWCGLANRGLVVGQYVERRIVAYHLTDEGTAVLRTLSREQEAE